MGLICLVCHDKFTSSKILIAHIQLFHRPMYKWKHFSCVQHGCDRSYDRIDSYFRHLAQHNAESLTPGSTEFLDSTNSQFLASPTTHDSEFLSRERPSGIDDIVADAGVEIPSEVVVQNANEHDSFEFEEALSKASLTFLGQLYNNDTLTKKLIQLVVDSHIKLLNGRFFNILKDLVINLLVKSSNKANDIERVRKMFYIFQNMYSDYDTERKRERAFEKCHAYVKPDPCVLGAGTTERYVRGNISIEPINLIGQFIPMRQVLKGFLELPGVLDKILSYMDALKNQDDQIIENIVQGKLWVDKIKPLFNDKIVLPLILYYDDYETCEMGTHTGVHKLGGVYYTVPSIPPEFRGQLQNIFTAFIFYAWDKFVGNSELYRQLLIELQYLEDIGISVITPEGRVEQIRFGLCLILGDNLGVHSILGMVESFSANHNCRRCSIHRDIARTLTKEDDSSIRTPKSYEEALSINDVTSTGIKERCIWNCLKAFHCTENVAFDIMHDLDEGAWHYDMCSIISTLVERKRFSYAELNNRVQGFDYNYSEISNKPPPIQKEYIQKSKLRFSASEMLCFVRYFGLMIGDFIHPDDDKEIWSFYQVIREIVDIMTAPIVRSGIQPILTNLVSEHHRLYLTLFPGQHLKPKQHHMLHYAKILDNIGPLVHVSCIRFEAKHKEFKQAANTCCNHRNLPYTLAVKTQMKFCFRLLIRNGLEATYAMASVKQILLDEIPEQFVQNWPADQELNVVNWFESSGTRYRMNSVVVTALGSDYPVFGKIDKILVANDCAARFLLRIYRTVCFNNHFHAYEVLDSSEWQCINSCDLITHTPSHIRIGPDGKQYVAFRYML